MNKAQIPLPARKGGLWKLLWRGWIGWAFRRNFDALHLSGAHHVPPAGAPIIFAANHCSWWDGFVAHLVMERLFGYDGFVPMEEKNLRRFPTMTRLGAFGLNRERPRSAYASLRWAARTLQDKPGRALWIFPQGALLPQGRRPLVMEGGAAFVAQAVGAPILPVAVRYEMRDRPRPEVFVRVGPPVSSDGPRRAITARLGAALTHEVDSLAEDIAEDAAERSMPAIVGAQGIDAWWEGLKARFSSQPSRSLGEPHGRR